MDKEASEIFARNLSLLMEHHPEFTQQRIAKVSGLAQTTISNMLNPGVTKKGPTLQNIADVAAVFGLKAWQMLIDGQTIDTLTNHMLAKIVENAVAVDSPGRENIARIAENEVRYCVQPIKKASND